MRTRVRIEIEEVDTDGMSFPQGKLTTIEVTRSEELPAIVEAVSVLLASRGGQIRDAFQQITTVLSGVIDAFKEPV